MISADVNTDVKKIVLCLTSLSPQLSQYYNDVSTASTYNDSYLIKAVAATVATLFFSQILVSVVNPL